MEVRLWQVVMVTCIILSGSKVSGKTVEVLRDLKLRAQYHFQSFKRDLDSIRALQDDINNSEDINLSSEDDHMRWHLYLSPMLDFCEDLKSLKVEMKNTTSTTSTTPASTTRSPHPYKDGFVFNTRPYVAKRSEWYLPAVRPIRARAEREGTKVRLIFDVIHNRPAFAVRVDTFQYAKAFLKVPTGPSGNFLSQVQFVTDASACSSGNFDFKVSYQFIPQDLEEGGTFVSIDTCGFDKYQNMSLESWERKWLTNNTTVEGKPEFSKFRIVSKTRSNDIVKEDRNIQIDVELSMDSTTLFVVFGSFYDYGLRIPLADSALLRVKWTGGLQIERSKENRIKLMKLKVLKFVTLNNKTDIKDTDQNTNATVRITVQTKNTNLGGNLVMRSFRYRNDYYNRELFDTVGIDRVLTFNQPGESYPPPDLEPVVRIHKVSICTEEGDKIFPREGRNCTLSCNGFGPNITSISISKNDSKLIPYRSVSYVLNNTASAKIDVGPASSANEGVYVCVVESSNGRVESSATLYTSGLPKILQEESTLLAFDNGTTEVTCKATGAQPLKMKMSIKVENGPYKRIDNNSSYSRTREILNRTIVLKLRIPTNHLKFPKYILKCEAKNERGSDIMQYFLYNDVKGYYDPVVPKLDEGASGIVHYKNGTTAITCKSTGAFPLDVMVLYGGRSEHFRIDDDNANIKMEESTNESQTTTLLINSKTYTWRTSWIHCFAKNEYGHDILDYRLDD